MSRNTHSNPKLYIDDKLIEDCNTASINVLGGTQLTKFTANIMDPDIEEASLFGKKVEYFLNYGSEDSTPIFRGYITNVNGTEKGVKIAAVDVRGYLSVDFRKIELTDENNYDGFTLGQFLKHYIEKFINTDKIYINTDKINDTIPTATLKGQRGDFKVYNLISNVLKNSLDVTDDNNPLDYSISTINDEEYSSIVFVKKKRLDAVPSMSLSRTDGIIKLSYQERPRKFVASLKDRDFIYGSNPSGPFNLPIKNLKKDSTPEELRELARREILKNFDNNIEIKIEASKGHYIGVGNIVYLNVRESLISGPHRITGKNISVNKNKVSLKLSLSQEPIQLSEYLNN